MNSALVSTPLVAKAPVAKAGRRGSLRVQAKSIEVNTGLKGPSFRPKSAAGSAPKLLTRVEQLRLLSKVEEAGLLSLAEKNGLSLSKIEDLGLLSKAEQLGALSLVTDRNTPGLLTGTGLALLLAGPAVVYFYPDGDAAALAIQYTIAALLAAGGAAAIAGGSVIGKLQK